MNLLRKVVTQLLYTKWLPPAKMRTQRARRPERRRERRARHANRTRDTQQAEYPSRVRKLSDKRLQGYKRVGCAHPIQPAGCAQRAERVPLRGTQFPKDTGNTKFPDCGVNAGVRRAQRDRRRSPRRPRAVPGRNASFRSRRVAGEPRRNDEAWPAKRRDRS